MDKKAVVHIHNGIFSSVQFSSVTQSDSLRPHEPQHTRPPCHHPPPSHYQLLESTQTHVHHVGDAIQLSHPPLSPFPPPSVFQSIRVFSNESALCIRWSKYWSFSFNISPTNEHPGLISFRVDWLDLLEIQGIQESSPTPQFKSIISSVLSFLYIPSLTSIHDYWKNHSLD